MSSNRANERIRFLNGDLQLGYFWPQESQSWSFSLWMGMYLKTTFASAAASYNLFGFKNLRGPEIFPLLRWRTSWRGIFSTYVKFSPIANGTSLLPLSSHDLNCGLSYAHPYKRDLFALMALNFNQLDLTVNGSHIQSDSMSASVGLTW